MGKGPKGVKMMSKCKMMSKSLHHAAEQHHGGDRGSPEVPIWSQQTVSQFSHSTAARTRADQRTAPSNQLALGGGLSGFLVFLGEIRNFNSVIDRTALEEPFFFCLAACLAATLYQCLHPSFALLAEGQPCCNPRGNCGPSQKDGQGCSWERTDCPPCPS